MRILVVDDEKPILQGLAYIIEHMNTSFSHIETAQSAETAFRKMREQSFDLVMTDICMPGLSGLQLIDQAMREGLCKCFVILSGFSEFEYAQEAIRQGVIDYLLKPIDKVALKDLLLRCVKQINSNRSANVHQVEELLRDAIFLQENKAEFPYVQGSLQCLCLLFDPGGMLELETINAIKKILPLNDILSIRLYGCAACILLGQVTVDKEEEFKLPEIPACRQHVGYSIGRVSDQNALRSMFLGSVEACLYGLFCTGRKMVRDFEIAYVPMNMDMMQRYDETRRQIMGSLSDTRICGLVDNSYAASMFRIIEREYKQNLTLDCLAKKIGINPAYAGRLFKQQFKTSFVQYLNDYRINKAIGYLYRFPDWTLEQVSAISGFQEPRNFYRVFKQITGITPGESRQKSKAKGGE